MSIIEGVTQFHVYLTNQHLKLFTDHKAIVWLRNFKHTNNRLLRWALRLQDYDFEIIYKEGSKNTAADCLSRRSYPPTEQQVMEKDSMQVVNDDIPDPWEIIEATFEYYPEAVANLHTTDIDDSIEPPSQDDQHADIRDHTKQKDIIRFQQECPYFKHIYNFLDEGTLPNDPKRAHAIPYEANQYIMLDGILYHLYQRRMKKKVKEEDTIRQLAVPTKLRHEIRKTYDSIRQNYFWPGMYQDIHKYITTCKACQVTKRDAYYASFAYTRCFVQVAHGHSCWLTKNKRRLSVHSSID